VGVGRIDRKKHDLDVMERVLSRVRDAAADESPTSAVQVNVVGLVHEPEGDPPDVSPAHARSGPQR